MWGSLLSAFLSDIPTGFPYSVDKPQTSAQGGSNTSQFTLTTAQHKTDKSSVSALIFDKKNASQRNIEEAQKVMKLAKCLRHPSLLKVLDALETNGAIYIVIEPCDTLQKYLDIHEHNRLATLQSLAWNLKGVSAALAFLHSSANQAHLSVCPESIYITPDGQWKLGIPEIGLTSSEVFKPDALTHPARCLFEPQSPRFMGPLTNKARNSFLVDRYMLACTVALVSNACKTRKSLASVRWDYQSNRSAVPRDLSKFVNHLAEKTDLDWESEISQCAAFASNTVEVLEFFNSFALKNSWDKEKFFELTFPQVLNDTSVEDTVKSLVYLPKMAKVFQESSAMPQHLRSTVLRLYMKLLSNCSLLSKADFDTNAWPTIYALYGDPERATRFMLLQNLPEYAAHLSSNQVSSIIDKVLSGLLDSSPELRDVTLRALTLFLPKLLESGKNSYVDKSIKQVSALITTDCAANIRTNATICLGKVAPLIPSRHVTQIVGPGFCAAVQDTFGPCRLAGIEGIRSIIKHIPYKDIATSYLPILCPRLVDDNEQCRQAANAAVSICLERINTATSANSSSMSTPMSLAPPPTAPPPPPPTTHSAGTRTEAETPQALPASASHGSFESYEDMSASKEDGGITEAVCREPSTFPRRDQRQIAEEAAPAPIAPPIEVVMERKAADEFWSEVNQAPSSEGIVVKKSLGAKRRGKVE